MLKSLNKISMYALAMVFFVACSSAFAENRVVLKSSDVVVTTEDFDRYLTDAGITGAHRERVLAQQGAVQAVFENIYVVRAFAAKGQNNDSIDHAYVDWAVAHFRAGLLMKKQLELEVQAALSNTDWNAVAKEYYTAKKSDYKVGDQISVDHILISTADRTPKEAKASADNVLARLQAGDEFKVLAQEYSDDQSNAAKGGNLGFFKRNSMVKPFEDVAFAMTEEGEISGPVETQYGYHIIKFNERILGRQQSFEEVKAKILPIVKASAAADARESQIEALKKVARDGALESNRPVLNEYVQRYSIDTDVGNKQ